MLKWIVGLLGYTLVPKNNEPRQLPPPHTDNPNVIHFDFSARRRVAPGDSSAAEEAEEDEGAWQLTLTMPSKIKNQLQSLAEQTGSEDIADAICRAIAVWEALVKIVSDGGTIIARDKKGASREVHLPIDRKRPQR